MTTNASDEPRPPSDPLDEIVAAANVLTLDDAAALDFTHGFDGLFAHIVADDVIDVATQTPTRTRRRHPRHRRPASRTIAALALTASLVVGGATAAAAKWRSVHTGHFGQPGDTEDTPGQEFLDLAGDGLPALAARLAKDIPYPPGDSAGAYIPHVFRGGGEMQADGIRMVLSLDAVCAWQGYWLQSDRLGDTAGRARATAVLTQVPTWPILVKTDGGGVIDSETGVADAAQRGDPEPVRADFSANCTTLPQRWAK
jgi:hypothetical protein